MALTAADFELLLQANRILSSKLDVNEVLLTVLKLATEVVRAEVSSILLLDEKTNELYFDVALGSAQESVKQIRLKVGEGIAGWVAKENKPLIVNDVSKDPRFTARVDKSTSFKTQSVLAVPLAAKGRLIGVVEAINKVHNQEFSEQDREIFEAFASQSAIAIENAQLFSAVKREKEKLYTVFAEMNDGVLLLDENGKTILLNEAVSHYLGHTVLAGAGKMFGAELFSEFQTFPTIEDLGKMGEAPSEFELARTGNKDLFLTAFVQRLSADEKTRPGGYLVVLHDATEEKREEKLKRNFLSLMSHKLKTPLTVIVGYAPTLLASAEGLNDFQRKALKAIGDQGAQLAGLVDKLLRFSVIESDESIKKNDQVQMGRLIQAAVDYFEDEAQEKNVSLVMEGDPAALPEIKTDQKMTLEMIKNLIENGIKFNDKEKKEVKVAARVENNAAVISVADNGVGIPPEEREKIFQKFYQIENSFTGQVPGAGLGLAFCRKVAEALGGTISLDSQIGKGSTFTIILPL